jgi:serine O-acetyltransferase
LAETPSTEEAEWPPRAEREILEGNPTAADVRRLLRMRHAKQPKALRAILEDARVFSAYRREKIEDTPLAAAAAALRLSWKSDAFLSLALYRIRVRLNALGVPVVPRLLHKVSMSLAQVCIGDPVVMEPGVYIPHGQVVIDGLVHVGSRVVFAPWVSVGLEIGHYCGARISEGAYIGTGARLIGPVRVGAWSQVAANSVVLRDVPQKTTVAGAPARVVGASRYAVKFPTKS